MTPVEAGSKTRRWRLWLGTRTENPQPASEHLIRAFISLTVVAEPVTDSSRETHDGDRSRSVGKDGGLGMGLPLASFAKSPSPSYDESQCSWCLVSGRSGVT